jgi:hypothetical protein
MHNVPVPHQTLVAGGVKGRNFLLSPGVSPRMAYARNPISLVDSWRLAWEASTVIGLRVAKMATMHPDNLVEMHKMVAEKMEAAQQIQVKAMTGRLGSTGEGAARKVVAHYRKAVSRNRRRLTRTRK